MVKLRDKESALTLRKWVFFPPWILLVIMVGFSLISNEKFIYALNIITNSILDNFAWLFNMTTILSVFTVIIVYFSPLGNVRIGGRKAKPMMSFTNLTWITLCTTIAAGILFWAAAEPLYHMYEPAIYTKNFRWKQSRCCLICNTNHVFRMDMVSICLIYSSDFNICFCLL